MYALGEKRRFQLLEQLTAERSDIHGYLIRELSTNSNPQKFAAAYLIGLYRMERAVEDLSEVITIEDSTVNTEKHKLLWSKHPAVEALIRIGNPAVPKMLELIQQNSDPKVRDFAARVILDVDGAEVGEFRLVKAIESQRDVEKKDRLKNAIQFFRNGK